MPLKRPPLESIAPMLFQLAAENGRTLPPDGTPVDLDEMAGLQGFTHRKLQVADFGPTLDTVLLGTGYCRYDVTLDERPLAYYVLRPGVSHPVEYGTEFVDEIAKYRHRHTGEARLCYCLPVATALWWPDANRVVVLHTEMDWPEWIGREMHGEEFHAWLTAGAFQEAVMMTVQKSEDEALDLLYTVVDDWLDEGRIEAVRNILRIWPTFDVLLALGLLTITGRARDLLGSARVGFYRRVEAHLRAERPEEAAELLRGLA